MRKGASKKTKLLIALIISTLAICIATPTLAYFTADRNASSDGAIVGKDVTGIKNVNISDFDELIAYASGTEAISSVVGGKTVNATKGNDNDASEVNALTERLYLTFTGDIEVTSDLCIYTDCHLDLNGYTLYLNGYEIAFKHTYRGGIVISDGTVVTDNVLTEEETEAKNGRIVFETPFAFPALDNVTFKSRAGEEIVGGYVIVDGDTKSIGYSVISLVAESIINYADCVPKKLSYGALNALTVTTNESGAYVFGTELFLNKKSLCHTSGLTESCAYVFDDLILPNHYLSYDGVTVEYISSAPEVISERGNVVLPTESADVDLTVNVIKDGTIVATTTFKLHVINPGNETALNNMGKTIIQNCFNEYYRNTAGEGETESYAYVFKRSVQLPLKITVGNAEIDYEYNAYKDAGKTSVSSGRFVKIEDTTDFILFESAEEVKTVSVKVNGAETLDFNIVAEDAGLIRTHASIAQDFIRDNYGGSIKLPATYAGDILTGFETKVLYTPLTGNADESIESIRYELMNDSNGLYALSGCDAPLTESSENGELYVASWQTKNPLDYVQSVQLNCIFNFKDGATESIQLSIECLEGQGTNLNGFLPYYGYYDQMFFATVGNYTVNSFTMPFAYGTDGPVVCYELAPDTKDSSTWNNIAGLSISLYFNGTDHVLDLNSTSNNLYSEAFDNLGVTCAEIISYGDAVWKFNIDKSLLGVDNVDFSIIYEYVMRVSQSGEDSFTAFVDSSSEYIVTDFTLPGVLHCGVGEEVESEVLYQWMYNTFGTGAYTDGEVVLTDWLKQNIDMNAETDTDLLGITDFKGIEYLKGTTFVNLSGIDFSDEAFFSETMTYISQMSGIEKLYLAGCNINAGDTTAPESADLNKLALLTNLNELRLNNNNIYSFEFLLDIPSLNYAYVYGNLSLKTVDGIFYGSEGLVNMQYFQEMTNYGIYVYNTYSDSTEFLFEETNGVNDFKNLCGIVYQKKLSAQVSITEIYKTFSVNPSDYGLKSSYTLTGTSTTYAVSNQTLSWGYIGDDEYAATQFAVTYNFTINSKSVSIKAKFEIVRMAE